MTRQIRSGMYGGDQFDRYHGIEACDKCGNELGSRDCAEAHEM